MNALSVVPSNGDDEPEVFEDLAGADFQARSSGVGQEFKHIARDYLIGARARFTRDRHRIGTYNVLGIVAGDNDQQFIVLAHGVIDDDRQAGLRRTDTIKKAGYDAIQLRRLRQLPILLITSHLPNPGTDAAAQLADSAPDIFDVIATSQDLPGFQRLDHYLHSPTPTQQPALWREDPSGWTPELFDSDDLQIPVTIRYGATHDDGDVSEEVEF